MSSTFSPTILEDIHAQYEQAGHVSVKDVYQPIHALKMGVELDDIFKLVPSRPGNLGEQRRSTEHARITSKHACVAHVLGSIGKIAASVLNIDLWPASPGMNTLLQTVDMSPHAAGCVEGEWHRDIIGIKGPVGITTYQGRSKLEIDDGTIYDLEPGSVAFLNNNLRPLHRGLAEVPRRAMLVAMLVDGRKSKT